MRCLRRLFGQDRKPHRPKASVALGPDTIGGCVAVLHTTINNPVAEIGHVVPQAATSEDNSSRRRQSPHLRGEVGDAPFALDNNAVPNILTQTREGITNDGSRGGEGFGSSQAFRALVERSVMAWHSLDFVGENKDTSIEIFSAFLQGLDSIEALMQSHQLFWFFQLRDSFMEQNRFMRWDPDRLDQYVLLPLEYGFANKQDCFFISHYWRTQEHPDPDGEDCQLIREDLGNTEWSYIWLDWTCLPQGQRSEAQKRYFKTILRRIPMLIRDCAWEWRYPAFRPRLWILFEVASTTMFQISFETTADIKPFISDVQEMINKGVSPVLDEREYKCTNESDTQLVTGWLELQILIFKLVPQVVARRAILDHLDQPYLGGVHDYDTGIDIDKASGVIFFRGRTYDFTPIYHLTLDKPDPRATPDFSILHRILTTAEERDFLRLLETDEQTRPEHHMTLLGLETVAALLERRRLYKIAERFHRRVLMSREMALGPHHEDTLDSVHKVAAVLLMQERYRAASLFSHRYLLGGTAGDEPANTAPSGFGN